MKPDEFQKLMDLQTQIVCNEALGNAQDESQQAEFMRLARKLVSENPGAVLEALMNQENAP